jgi:tryptophan synthase beta subunit
MKIKICGITHPEDAKEAALSGADYIGIIFSPRSKRGVSLSLAKKIALAAKQNGAEPVGVFIDETIDQILSLCKKTELSIVQLHRLPSEQEISALRKHYSIICTISVALDGSFQKKQKLPKDVCPLFDSLNGGTGLAFDWEEFSPPTNTPWILAGGLNAENVATAIHRLNPYAVDVSSGVEYPNNNRKDPVLLKSFIQAAKKAKIERLTHPHPFGGQFLPEILMTPIEDLTKNWETLKNSPNFHKELDLLLKQYAGRPTPLTEVKNFSKSIDGPRIFLKREDLLHTGAHKINNALGQCLLAKYLGKTRIIAETGAGQHGVATATACAHLGLACIVYMGAKDIQRQKPNVEKMELLGAKIISVHQGSSTLKDAINEALRDWSANYEDSHYCLGSALGPHPYPEMVRTFQSVISLEVKKQIGEFTDRPPDLLIACVGGGSNAIGLFHHFISNKEVTLIGVEAGGRGNKPGQHAARFSGGSPGVLHGCYTYLLQDEEGQILPTHSVSAGLDYPGVGPDHSSLYESERATYATVTDIEALEAFHLLATTEGILPALESSHALAYIVKIAPKLNKESLVIINLSGRGDKDLSQVIASYKEAAQ